MTKKEDLIGAAEVLPSRTELSDVPPPAPPPDRVEGLNKRASLLVTILTTFTLICGGMKAISDVNSHFATLDQKADTSQRRQDKLSEKYDKLQGQQNDAEQAEHGHYEELLKHATKTETNVEWIIRQMQRGQ